SPIVLIFFFTLNNIASIYKVPTKGISALHNHLLYTEFRKWLKNNYISDDAVWNYVLPYVAKQKEIKNQYSFVSFFRDFLQSISVSIPVAILSMMVAILIADPEAKEWEKKLLILFF